MLPNPIPQEPGCLSVRLHAGSWPSEGPLGMVTLNCGTQLPIVGTCGTNDPARWRHVVWFEGEAFTAELKCDVPGFSSSLASLMEHCALHSHVWKCITPAKKSD